MSTLIPLNGVDRCYCGCVYWAKVESDLPPYSIYLCFACEEPYEPELPETDDAITAVFDDDDEPDYDAYHDAFLASVDDEAEARRWEAAHCFDMDRDTDEINDVLRDLGTGMEI